MLEWALPMLAYYVCAVAFLGSAIDIAGEIGRVRPRRHLWRAGAFLVLAAVFTLLAISAGPAPVLRRTDVIVTVRALCLVAGSALLFELSLKWFAVLRRMLRNGKDST
jgi:hypothetical protein